ncbi:SOS response-associated peptidase [Actinocorallia longicatena]|uniref:Abasic site processing protein n=1 Tax=Actinocorallia longicatena TaxID=111803 RepID=A0ABP6Q336_9ACTN
MCGRYATARARQELLDEFRIDVDETLTEDGRDLLEADYNVAPTKLVPAVIQRAAKDAPEEAVPERRLRMLRWGLVPSWAKDLSIGSRMINARVETAAEKPSFRKAFAARRCLLPADGYFEWYTGEDGKKQPFFITPKDRSILPMAGLYELWKSPEGEWVWTTTVLTTEAADELGHIHDRMPMVVTDRDAWLDPGVRDPSGLLVPAMAGGLEAFPVSKAVGNVKNNGSALIEPLTNGQIPGESNPSLF